MRAKREQKRYPKSSWPRCINCCKFRRVYRSRDGSSIVGGAGGVSGFVYIPFQAPMGAGIIGSYGHFLLKTRSVVNLILMWLVHVGIQPVSSSLASLTEGKQPTSRWRPGPATQTFCESLGDPVQESSGTPHKTEFLSLSQVLKP